MPQITTSIMVSDPLERAPTHCGLSPFSVSIAFLGQLPSGLAEKTIPLRISVSLPEEYADYTLPILRPSIAKAPSNSSAASRVGDVPHQDENTSHSISSWYQDTNLVFDRPVIPFLPLDSAFDPSCQESWRTLWPQISDWLVTVIIEPDSYEWHWGVKAFWMAYATTNPRFPGGEWETWDPRIALNGHFIQQWIEAFDKDSGRQHFHGSVISDCSSRLKIWVKFQALLKIFCPTVSLM